MRKAGQAVAACCSHEQQGEESPDSIEQDVG